MTILLCDLVASLDEKSVTSLITIFIPANMDKKNRIVKSLNGWPGWENVPLADWLELRLNRSIMLLPKKSFLVSNDAASFFDQFQTISSH